MSRDEFLNALKILINDYERLTETNNDVTVMIKFFNMNAASVWDGEKFVEVKD